MAAINVGKWRVFLLGSLLLGCAHNAVVPAAPVDAPFTIGREDVLDVAVWRDPDLSRTVPVRPDGYISIPMVGELKAEGKTPLQLEETIRERLSPYIKEPRVTVIVREVNSSRVFVTGEVAHPGAYPLRGKVSLIQAIALAGGFSEFANENGIVVIRQGPQHGRIPVSYRDLISGDSRQLQFFLMPGDTVVVP